MIPFDFSQHSIDDLIDLNKRIVDYVKKFRERERAVTMLEFNCGDRVQFKNPAGQFEQGMVVKVNRKTLIVHSDSHVDWKVSPGALELVEKFAFSNERFAQTPFSK